MGKKGGNQSQTDNASAAQARQDEIDRQASIRSGTSDVNNIFDKNFSDDFYKKQQQGYVDYAKPQLDRQYGDTQKQLTYSLARGGNLDSSARGQQEGQLKYDYDTNNKAIDDQALSLANTTRNNVEGTRADLIKSLNVSGDAAGAANNATTRAAALSLPPAYSPLANMFSTFTSGLGTQAALEKANYYSGGAVKPAFNTGLFGNSGAVKVSQ